MRYIAFNRAITALKLILALKGGGSSGGDSLKGVKSLLTGFIQGLYLAIGGKAVRERAAEAAKQAESRASLDATEKSERSDRSVSASPVAEGRGVKGRSPPVAGALPSQGVIYK
jgi:hypothetical protein